MLGFVITTFIFLIVLVYTRFSIGSIELDANWEEQRCRPDVMMTSGLYGKDAEANVQHCMTKGFDARAKKTVIPFYSIMGAFGDTLSSLITSINSTKVTFATLVGSASSVFTEFSSRLQNMFFRMYSSVVQMKILMSRIFSTMHAIMYMGESAIQAGMNFERTDLWNTVRNFSCFDPDTQVLTLNRGIQFIKNIEIGDTLENGQKVTGFFEFNGDGQEMVILPEGRITVSGPHAVLQGSKWIKSSEHPDSMRSHSWNGGNERPLICLNTTNHTIQIGKYTFTDYDETAEGNKSAMAFAIHMLNGWQSAAPGSYSSPHTFTRGCHPDTLIRLKDGSAVPANTITLGTSLSHGTVTGVVKTRVTEVCYYGNEVFTPATAIWSEQHKKYMRLGDFIQPQLFQSPAIFCAFFVSPSAVIETSEGTMFRDYLEIHSNHIESSYADALYKS
jgi:hypothetical protein